MKHIKFLDGEIEVVGTEKLPRWAEFLVSEIASTEFPREEDFWTTSGLIEIEKVFKTKRSQRIVLLNLKEETCQHSWDLEEDHESSFEYKMVVLVSADGSIQRVFTDHQVYDIQKRNGEISVFAVGRTFKMSTK